MQKAFNAKTQQHEDVTWSYDRNGEIVCTFADGTFLKFPAGTSKEKLAQLLELHYQENNGNEVITPEMEVAKAAQEAETKALVDELNGNTMPEGDQNNAASDIINDDQSSAESV